MNVERPHLQVHYVESFMQMFQQTGTSSLTGNLFQSYCQMIQTLHNIEVLKCKSTLKYLRVSRQLCKRPEVFMIP